MPYCRDRSLPFSICSKQESARRNAADARPSPRGTKLNVVSQAALQIMVSTSAPLRSLPPRLRAFFYVLIAIVLALLLAGVGGFVWLASGNPFAVLNSGDRAPAAMVFVPRQAPAVVSLLVNPDRLEAFRLASVRPSERRRARTQIDRLKQSLLQRTGLDYEQDIKPWIGDEVTFAVTAPDFDRDPDNGDQAGYLLAIDSRDSIQAREFLQLFWQKQAIAGATLVFEQFAGVKIVYSDGNPAGASLRELKERPQPPATALVGNRFVLFANHPKVLREAVNNVQAPELGLSNTAAYQRAIEQFPKQQGVAFINFASLAGWLDKTQVADLSQRYESLAAALKFDRRGLIADTTLLAASGETLPTAKPQLAKSVGALKFIPAASPLAAGGEDLRQFRAEVAAGIAPYKPLADFVDRIQSDLESRWSLQPEDLFDWVTGEFALGMIAPIERKAPPDWIFVTERTSKTSEQLARFDQIASDRGLSTVALSLDDQAVSTWTKLSTEANSRSSEGVDLKAEVQGVRASVGNYEILATSVEAMRQALNARSQPITESENFDQAIAALDRPNDGYFYLDWPTIERISGDRIPLARLARLAAKPVLENVRSLTVTSYGSEPTLQRGAIYFRLKDT